jgi:hypothetical protein
MTKEATRSWISVVIFLSSYSPLAAVLFLRDLDCDFRVVHPAAAWTLLTVGLLSVALLFIVMRGLNQGFNVTVTKVNLRSSDLVNYTIPYMVSFFGFNLSDTKDLVVFGLFLILMCYLTIRTQNVFINPILALRGYGLYEVEYEERHKVKQSIFLSKIELDVGGRIEIQKLTRFLSLVITTENEKQASSS